MSHDNHRNNFSQAVFTNNLLSIVGSGKFVKGSEIIMDSFHVFRSEINRSCWSSYPFMHSSNPKEIVRSSKTQSRKFISRSYSRQFNAIFLSGTWKNCRENVYYFAEAITNNRNCDFSCKLKFKYVDSCKIPISFKFYSSENFRLRKSCRRQSTEKLIFLSRRSQTHSINSDDEI